MSARFALESFHWNNGTATVSITKGAKRDSASAIVTANPGMFSSAALPPPPIHPMLQNYMIAYPAGPEL